MTITSRPMWLHGALLLPRHVAPGVSLPAIPHNALLFVPKCIALLLRHNNPGTLHNCLMVIYTAHSECLVGPGGERIKL
jgi:hypothetical protein